MEKHAKSVSKPFNLYGDRSPAADLEVGFSWRSGHRPLRRGIAYGLEGTFHDSLQPVLLRSTNGHLLNGIATLAFQVKYRRYDPPKAM